MSIYRKNTSLENTDNPKQYFLSKLEEFKNEKE